MAFAIFALAFCGLPGGQWPFPCNDAAALGLGAPSSRWRCSCWALARGGGVFAQLCLSGQHAIVALVILRLARGWRYGTWDGLPSLRMSAPQGGAAGLP